MKPLTEKLNEAAQWCAGEQNHTVYPDSAYIELFREASARLAEIGSIVQGLPRGATADRIHSLATN